MLNKYICLCFTSLFFFFEIQAQKNIPEDSKVLFKTKDALSAFPIWLSDQLLHKNIPFGVNLMEVDYLFNNLVYADTLSYNLDVFTTFTVTKKGKIENCKIENLQDARFCNEIKRIVCNSGKWKLDKKNGKKTAFDQHFIIPLALKGQVMILDGGLEWGEPDKKVNGKRYNLTRALVKSSVV